MNSEKKVLKKLSVVQNESTRQCMAKNCELEIKGH